MVKQTNHCCWANEANAICRNGICSIWMIWGINHDHNRHLNSLLLFLNCITTTLKSVRCGKASRPEQNLSKSACEKRLGRKCSWNSCQSHIKLLLVIGGGWTWRHTLDGLCTFVGIPVLVWARKRRGSSTKSGIWVPGRKLPGRTFAANLDHQLWIALNGIINNWQTVRNYSNSECPSASNSWLETNFRT